jgi:hypothetical protein
MFKSGERRQRLWRWWNARMVCADVLATGAPVKPMRITGPGTFPLVTGNSFVKHWRDVREAALTKRKRGARHEMVASS